MKTFNLGIVSEVAAQSTPLGGCVLAAAHLAGKTMLQDDAVTPRFDKSQALARVGDDEDLLKEITVLFLDDLSNMLAAIERAIQAGDASATERASHSLKGCVSNFGAAEAHAAAFALEKMGRARDLHDARQGYSDLLARIGELRPELEAFIAGS